jgi:hypothetical protein
MKRDRHRLRVKPEFKVQTQHPLNTKKLIKFGKKLELWQHAILEGASEKLE